MNRRSFVTAMSVGVAFHQMAATAQRGTTSTSDSTTVISQATGAAIDFSQSGFSLAGQSVDQQYGVETIQLVDNGTELDLFLFPAGMVTTERLFETYIRNATSASEQLESLGTDTFDDGGWIAIAVVTGGVNRGSYLEFQSGAFPEYDVAVQLIADSDLMMDAFERAQTIDFEGAPPFLFLDESKANTDMYVLNGTGTTTGRRPGSSPGSNRETPSAPASDDATFIQTLISERSKIWLQAQQVSDALDLFFSNTASNADIDAARSMILDLPGEWLDYPYVAREIAVPAGSEALGELYMDWAYALGDAGGMFLAAIGGKATSAEANASFDTFQTLDDEFADALGVPHSTIPLIPQGIV